MKIPQNTKTNTKIKTIIGIMTGTSVDKIDVAAVEFSSPDENYKFKILNTFSYEIPQVIKKNILSAASNSLTTSGISELNYKLSFLFVKVLNDFLLKTSLSKEKIDAVSIHGQTVWHAPYSNMSKINKTNNISYKHEKKNKNFGASTFQLCNASAMSAILNMLVISDFRAADFALGGEGAPLIPIFDFYFLRKKNKNIVALNIGGMANITLLPAGCSMEEIIAFDTGCGNVLIDEFMKKLYNKPFDESGNTARTGDVHTQLLDELLKLKYFAEPLPKSCGREIFNMNYVEAAINKIDTKINNATLIRTLTELTAITISEAIKQTNNFNSNSNFNNSSTNNSEVIIKGGGARNIFLIEKIEKYLNTTHLELNKAHKMYKISDSFESIGIKIDYYEAVAFAFLGYLNLLNKPGNIPSVTGAKHQVVLGSRSYNTHI